MTVEALTIDGYVPTIEIGFTPATIAAASGNVAMHAASRKYADTMARFGSAEGVVGPVESQPDVVQFGPDALAEVTEIGGAALQVVVESDEAAA